MAKTRKVVARASSRPPPRASEATALMVGMGRAERSVRVARRVWRKCCVLGWITVSVGHWVGLLGR